MVFFLFQNQFILENIIDVERTYNFPIEIEVCGFFVVFCTLSFSHGLLISLF